MSNPDTYQPRRPLGVALMQDGILSPDEIEEARAAESRTGETLAEFVLRTHPAAEEHLARLLAEEWGLPFVTGDELTFEPNAVERLPLTVARNLQALPIGFGGGTLVVAVTQPSRALFSRIADELGETSFVVVPTSVFKSLLAYLSAAAARSDAAEALPESEVASDVQAAREALALLVEAQAELARADKELVRLSGVERELHAARGELARLQHELEARDAALEAGEQLRQRDSETIRELEGKLASGASSTKPSKPKPSKPKSKKTKSKR